MEAVARSKEPFHIIGGDVGCLLLHGFASSPAEMEPFGKRLASNGLTVHCPVLAGHSEPAGLCDAGWQDWLEGARDALAHLRRQTRSTFIIGFSLGGLIAFDLASSEPVSGVVSVNSPLRAPSAQVLHTYLLKVRKESPLESASRVPMSCLSNLSAYAARVAGLLSRVSTPTLIIQARCDEVVDPLDARAIFDALPSEQKRLMWVDGANHLAILGPHRGLVFKATIDFIEQIATSESEKQEQGDEIR